jgi:hypothetical protein
MGLDDDANDSSGVVGGKLGAAGRVPCGKRSRGCLEAGCDFASCTGTEATPATG